MARDHTNTPEPDEDEVTPPYLADAILGTSGIHEPRDDTGATNARLISETVGPAHGVDDVTAYKALE